MKTISKTLLSVLAFVASGSMLFAQETQTVPDNYIDKGGLVYSKQVQGPNDKGEYTIFLKSYVTGTVTAETTSIPSDIVLVLDVSGSMNYDIYSPEDKTWTTQDINSGTYYYLYNDDYYEVSTSGNTIRYYRRNSWRNLSQNGSWSGVLYTRSTRLEVLKEGVAYFLDEIEKDARTNNVDNKVAIVKFSTDAFCDEDGNAVTKTAGSSQYTETGNHRGATGSQAGYSTNYNYTEVVMGFTSITASNLQSVKTDKVNTLNYGGPTAADYGMLKAEALIKSLYNKDTAGNPTTPLRTSNKIVVFFTDGDPTYYNAFNTTVATNAIATAKTLKALTAYSESGQSDNVKVYTIGTFSGTPDENTTNRFMQRLSSNYPNASNMNNNGGGDGGSDTGGYYFLASDKQQLINAFGSISSDAASSNIDLGTSSTVIDVVSKSFALPTGTDHSSVQVYTSECNGRGTDGKYTFKPQAQCENITNSITLVPGTAAEPNKVSVSGFDFEANLCARNTDGSYRGKELILEIPIVMDPNAVGGHGVGTNGPGSGIQYVDKDGNPGQIDFDTPDISLPINLHIRKEGLKLGESAKFTIQRKWKGDPDEIPEDIEADTWQDYTSVFVTRRSHNTESGENAPIVKIVGLHPDFIYRIKEEGWSWSYGVSRVYGSKYDPDTEATTTVTMQNGTAADCSDNTVTSDQINLNPFIFVNVKKDVESTVISVRHAESIVRNEFKEFDEEGNAKTGVTTNSKTQP